MANSSLNLLGLDYDEVKSALQTYMEGQDAFKDYDFEGSNLNELLSVLGYNTFKNMFYSSMVGSEMFLDSAQKRDNIISRAKELNYLPSSPRGASAELELSIVTDNTYSVTIPKYTSFTARYGSNTYTFTTNSAYSFSSNTTTITCSNVVVYEGLVLSEQFVASNDDIISCSLSNMNVDTSSIQTIVLENSGANVYEYSATSTLYDLTANSLVFFVEPDFNDKYKITFGDGVSGRKPAANSIIVIEYRQVNGTYGNKLSSFTNDGDIDDQSNVTITVTSNSSGGAWAESLESIRFRAPRHFATQERAITTSDYEELLEENFSEIADVRAIGGEDLDPPKYGKIAISILINDIDTIPDSYKVKYKSFLKKRGASGLTPYFIDPNYTYIELTSNVSYDDTKTSSSAETLKSTITSFITTYSQVKLEKFGKTFNYSQLLRLIDSSDSSIVGNDTSFRLYKKVPVTFDSSTSYSIDFGIAIDPSIKSDWYPVTSDTFTLDSQSVYIRDDGDGTLYLYTSTDTELYECGSVDYDSGTITINNLTIQSTDDSENILIYIRSLKKKISATGIDIFEIDSDMLDINVEAED